MKKLLSIILCITMIISMAACGKANEEIEPKTMEDKIEKVFLDEMKRGTDPRVTLDTISKEVELGDIIDEVSEGYLNGFSSDITGFSRGYILAPMIGSIPFVCYIFETDDADGLKAELEAAADPRWNICTQANDPRIAVYENYVMITMCPSEDME